MSGLRRSLVALAILAFAIGAGATALILSSDHSSPRGLEVALILTAGWGFVGTGLYAWDRRPGNRVGPLMTAIGFTWFLAALQSSSVPALFAIGVIGTPLPYGILVHLLVSFPSGRLSSRFERLVVAAAYLSTTVLQLLWGFFIDPTKQSDCSNCPENPLLISGHEGIANATSAVQLAVALFAIIATVVIVFRRWRRSSPGERRVLTPVVATGGLAFLILMAQLILSEVAGANQAEDIAYVGAIAVFACLPFGFLLGLLRSRIGRAEELSSELSVENAQLNAELEAKVAELRASRTRIVEAGYEERRKVERNLHDGAQQRLVALTMSLRLVHGKIETDPEEAASLLEEAMDELAEATKELRELARGIHPAVLSDHGLEAALGGLAERSPVPVEVLETPAQRLPAAVESATYFVIAEALTNVARYAEASAATVRVARENGEVEVEVSDDGVGGADPGAGSGLRGLSDRLAALEGGLVVSSPLGEGTTVRARIPCE